MTLLNFLKQSKEARKIFGERELKIIEKQLWGMSLSQSEKNRLSRDIRKKFEFISKVKRFEDEFNLKKGAEVSKVIDNIKEVILNHKWFRKISKVILYGSTVENERTLRSDVDIAVVFDSIDKKNAGLFRINILGQLGDRADVQVYNILPIKIRDEIDKKGRVIYERKNKR